MKRLLLVAVILLGFSMMVMAQDTPKAELFGGYSYLRCDTTQDLSCNLNGGDVSLSINGNKYIGVVADFASHAGDVEDTVHVNNFSFMFGPKFTVRSKRITPFAQALFGLARVKPGQSIATKYENHFAMAFGGGIDINVNDLLSVRPVQAEYYTVKLGSEFTNNFRYSVGIVLKFGKR